MKSTLAYAPGHPSAAEPHALTDGRHLSLETISPRVTAPASLVLFVPVVLLLSSVLSSCSPSSTDEAATVDADLSVARASVPGFETWGRAQVVDADRGMIASAHQLASDAGAEVLARGGNAIDAAVTTGFALAVVLPRAGNIGGGGFLVHRDADGQVRTLDYRETGPAAAHRDMYLDEAGEPTDKSVLGHLAAGVPGSVAGLWEMHQELGSLPWAELVAPAIVLAEGHVIDETRSDNIQNVADDLAKFETSAAQYLPDDAAPAAGSIWRQPELATTLRAIADNGRDGFYTGPVADFIVAEMERGGGIITHDDLAGYEPVWREVIEISYRDHTIYTMPPPSSGGITLGTMLGMLETSGTLPPFGSPELIHLEAEVMRRAFMDRNHWLGDPDFVEIPTEYLLSTSHRDDLLSTIEDTRATPTAELPPASAGYSESTETTHYSVVDDAGNAVSITTTLNGSFGSKVTVAGAGFLLNNEMDDFAASPGKPNMYGLVQGEANAVAPGKRMLSSMTPSIVVGPTGEVDLVVGSPGGPTIITTVYHVISNVIDHELSLAEAVEAPRVHHQALPDRIFYENGGLSTATVQTLEAMGHEVAERDGTSGNVSAIQRIGGSWRGVADSRRKGGAAGPAESTGN